MLYVSAGLCQLECVGWVKGTGQNESTGQCGAGMCCWWSIQGIGAIRSSENLRRHHAGAVFVWEVARACWLEAKGGRKSSHHVRFDGQQEVLGLNSFRVEGRVIMHEGIVGLKLGLPAWVF